MLHDLRSGIEYDTFMLIAFFLYVFNHTSSKSSFGMDLALLILSILSCFASALCLEWKLCMWFNKFMVAFCVANASFLEWNLIEIL